jgi:hypothetical protein
MESKLAKEKQRMRDDVDNINQQIATIKRIRQSKSVGKLQVKQESEQNVSLDRILTKSLKLGKSNQSFERIPTKSL